MIKLKEDALQKIELAIAHRFEAIITAYNKADSEEVVELMQCGLLSYEDRVEPSKLSLEDEFWSCISLSEKEQHRQDIGKILKYMQITAYLQKKKNSDKNFILMQNFMLMF